MPEIVAKAVRRRLKRPTILRIGGYTITGVTYREAGELDVARRYFTGASGTGWLKLGCLRPYRLAIDPDRFAENLPLVHPLEVVAKVVHRQTQIEWGRAHQIQPGISLGESLDLVADLEPSQLQALIESGKHLVDWFDEQAPSGQVLVSFEDVKIRRTAASAIGRIVKGEVIYPAQRRVPRSLRYTIEGFTVELASLILTPSGATAEASVELPRGLVDVETCGRIRISLGTLGIDPECGFTVCVPDQNFGPWIVGDSGIIISGRGFTIDLSSTESQAGQLPAWRGMLLHQGTASGAELVPEPANIAYLRGKFSFASATLTASGLDANLLLEAPHEFAAINPFRYRLVLEAGWLQMADSAVSAGEFGPVQVLLPRTAIRSSGGDPLQVEFGKLTVQPSLDLTGTIDDVSTVEWGELTHPGDELLPWRVGTHRSVLYLPANPIATFSPDTGSAFLAFSLSTIPDVALADVATAGMSGVSLRVSQNLAISSPDLKGTANPLTPDDVRGWLRVGTIGVDGEITTRDGIDTKLGNPSRPGYVGIKAFETDLFSREKLNLVAQYAASAVYDSNLNGQLTIPVPCGIELAFEHMKLSSTAHLVGGDISLPAAGVPLAYWQLQLVPTGDPSKAGVLSVRTGRCVFNAAGISEKRHFARPFGLTWGEMLADGNLGDLFFDYNNFGQKFDEIPYTASSVRLSPYREGTPDPYLATCGTVHFGYFGAHFVNIRDAVHHEDAAPFFSRYVTVPKIGDTDCGPTDLNLTAVWDANNLSPLSIFSFPDATMDYNVTAQQGFIGLGTSSLSFFDSNTVTTTIEIQPEGIDLSFRSTSALPISLGLMSNLGMLGEIAGCARIEGPLLKCISLYGVLEVASGTGGILSGKTGYMVEVNLTVTPTSLDFSAAGDMVLQAAAVGIDVSAAVHLLFDWSVGSAEGEVVGRINCNAAIAGLEGEGQVTWHIGSDMQYLQGAMRVAVAGWVGGGGLEGGFFVGHQVPKSLAWVLQTASPKFGVSSAVLPDTLSGVYGYGMLSVHINWYIVSGGVELFAGMGAFSDVPPGLSSAFSAPVLPYVVGGCGISVHGEILGGVVSASAWANLSLRGPIPVYFEGNFGLEGCALWVACASIDVTAGINSDGFYLY